MQSLNDMGLHHQLQAKEVITLEDALQIGEDYLRAIQLYTEETKGTQVTTQAVQLLGGEMDRLSNLLKQVAKIPTKVNTPHRGSKGETPKDSYPVWERQKTETSPLKVSPAQKTASLPPPAEASETPRAGQGATTGRVPPGVRTDSAGHLP